jgi:hypothetical protein
MFILSGMSAIRIQLKDYHKPLVNAGPCKVNNNFKGDVAETGKKYNFSNGINSCLFEKSTRKC